MLEHRFGHKMISLASRSYIIILYVIYSSSIYAYGISNSSYSTDIDAQIEKGVCKEVVVPKGYWCEEYHVTTEDGYIISMQRIPEGHGNGGRVLGGKRPVLLQHGLTMDATSWMLNAPDQSLPFVLADYGFDVWISNARGTKWSRNHRSLHPSSHEFWNWSWDQLVEYDFPATINFVHNKTGQKLHYVGHSLGTTMAMASLSERKMVDKLRSVALLTPIAYLSHMTTNLLNVAAQNDLAQLASSLGIKEFNMKFPVVLDLLREMCHISRIDCSDILTEITGDNCCLSMSTVENFWIYEPHSTSSKNLIHLSQVIRSGVVAKFDYGNLVENLMHYGSITPPKYNLTNIPTHIPLFLSYGGHDSLSDPIDVDILLHNHLQSHDPSKIEVQFVEKYAHMDFIMGIDAKHVVYDSVASFFHRHQ